MNNSDSRALKSGVWYTICNFLVRGIGFITTPIFTRLLTKTDFGLYSNYTSCLAIFTIIATLHLDSTLISARYDFEKRFDEYILSVLFLSTLSTSIWILIANVFSGLFVSILGMEQRFINAMLVYLLFLPAVSLFQARERYYYEYKKTVATSLFIAIGTSILSVLLVVNMQDRLAGRIIGSIVPTVLLGVIFYIFFLRKGKRITLQYWGYALPVCLPFIPHLLSLTLLNSTDRVMITKWCGAEDNAIYSLAYTCGSIVTMLMTSMNSAYAPWLGEKLNAGMYREIRQFSKKYMICFAVLATGVMAVAPEILYVLGGKEYHEARFIMPPIAMGCFCQFLYTLFVNVEQFEKKTVGMAFASVIAALLNLILNFIFIPKVGYLAAAYTTLAGYMCLLGIHMFLVQRLHMDNVYDYWLIIRMIIIMLIITVLINYMYSHSIIRYTFVVMSITTCVIVFIKNKDQVLGFIKRRE